MDFKMVIIKRIATDFNRFASRGSLYRSRLRISTLLWAFTLAFGGFAPCRVAAAQPDKRVNTKTLTLGLISEINQSAIEDHFRDFVDYVARRLSPGSEAEGKVVVAPTVFELAKLLEQNRVDFYFDSVYPTYTINYVHGVGKTLLRRWKGGVAEYQSLIFTKRGSGIRRLEDLRGRTIVFEDPGSTSGYILPKLFLQRSGFKLVEKREYDPFASPTEIKYLFAYAQDRLLEMVLTEQAGAGAFSDDDYAGLRTEKKAEINVLAQTERLPRHLVSVRANMPPQTAARLEEILLAMPEDAEGQRVLKRTDQTTKFDPVPGGEEGLRKRLLATFYSPDKK
jgi:ABC-type phosphate/phosphonate transport system substrate-binding protein